MSEKRTTDRQKKTAGQSSVRRQTTSSLQNVINSRYLNPFRSSLKKELFNSLYNGKYIDVFSSYKCLNSFGNISSISIDPQLNRALLHTSTSNELKVWQIQESEFNFTLESLVEIFYPGLNAFRHSQWFPTDAGLVCLLDTYTIQLIDTTTFTTINTESLGGDKNCHFDWNVKGVHTIAIATSTPTVKLYDIRAGVVSKSINVSGASNADRQHKGSQNTTRVLWSPLDDTGLFVGDSIGGIFFFDIRHLKRPIGQKRCDDHRYFLPVSHMEMTPDHLHLITSHGYYTPTITKWNFGKSGDDFLIDSNIHYQHTGRRGGPAKMFDWNQFSFFTTMDSIYIPNYTSTGPDLFAYNLQAGDAEPEKFLTNSNAINTRPVQHVIGYRRTKFGDDPNPAIIYTCQNKIIVTQWPKNTKLESLEETEGLRQSQPAATNHLHEDRWSDSD